jgi:hypothetical protein
MGRNQAIVAALAVAVLALAAATTLLYLDGDRADVELAALGNGLADRDDEVERLREQLADAEQQRRALEQRTTELEAAADRVEALEADLEASEDEVVQLRERLPATEDGAEQPGAAPAEASPSGDPTPSSTAPAAPAAPALSGIGPAAPGTEPEPASSACDQLGLHDLGEEACARLVSEMEACWDEVLNDPKWVEGDGPYYEHLDTGEITICDL